MLCFCRAKLLGGVCSPILVGPLHVVVDKRLFFETQIVVLDVLCSIFFRRWCCHQDDCISVDQVCCMSNPLALQALVIPPSASLRPPAKADLLPMPPERYNRQHMIAHIWSTEPTHRHISDFESSATLTSICVSVKGGLVWRAWRLNEFQKSSWSGPESIRKTCSKTLNKAIFWRLLCSFG